MTSKAKMTAGKIISLAVVLLLIIAAVGFAAYFSNGFTSEFKTFYVECNGEKILNDKDYYEMSANEEYCFDVKYLFDVGNKENKLGYHVKILPHTTKETNFDFTADGKTYNYGAEGELTIRHFWSAWGIRRKTLHRFGARINFRLRITGYMRPPRRTRKVLRSTATFQARKISRISRMCCLRMNGARTKRTSTWFPGNR